MLKKFVLMIGVALCLAGAVASAKERPDVLFIAIDDMNDWTTVFDKTNPIQTPHLERLAAGGMFFERAYCAAPACAPLRAAIMSVVKVRFTVMFTLPATGYPRPTCPTPPASSRHHCAPTMNIWFPLYFILDTRV